MKNLCVVFFALFIGFHTNAQKFDGYYVTNTNDTIKCSFDVEVNIFDSKIFERASVKNKVKILNIEGKKLVFKPNEINSFFIKGTSTGDYKFVGIVNGNNFYHEIIKGKISYYKLYRQNPGGALGTLIAEEYYLFKDGKLVEISPLNLRKGLSKQMLDYPELNQKWLDSDKFYKLNQFEEVIKLYNEHFKN